MHVASACCLLVMREKRKRDCSNPHCHCQQSPPTCSGSRGLPPGGFAKLTNLLQNIRTVDFKIGIAVTLKTSMHFSMTASTPVSQNTSTRKSHHVYATTLGRKRADCWMSEGNWRSAKIHTQCLLASVRWSPASAEHGRGDIVGGTHENL